MRTRVTVFTLCGSVRRLLAPLKLYSMVNTKLFAKFNTFLYEHLPFVLNHFLVSFYVIPLLPVQVIYKSMHV